MTARHLPNRPLSALALPLSVVLVALLALLPIPTARAAPANQLQSYLDEQVANGHVYGVSAVVLHDGEIVGSGAAGMATDDQPMTTTTPMRLESVSKSFTAMAVMQLVEDGKIKLDDPVVDQLPEFRTADPRSAQITVRHLLAQTSGLTDATSPDLYNADASTPQQAVARLTDATLATNPGSTWAYHNPNYHVLARLVEVTSGQQFGDYMDRQILKPLGMENTRSTLTTHESTPGMAEGHMLAWGHPFATDGPEYFVGGSGGMVSTADDMAAWLRLQGNLEGGSPVISAAGLYEMHKPQSADDYGFGWYNAESAEGPPVRISHSGAGAGFGAYEGIFPDSGWSVALMVNHGSGLTSPAPAVLAQNLLHQLDPQIPPLEEATNPARTDLILTALAPLTISLALLGCFRARRWAERRRCKSGWSTVLRLIPPLIPILWFATLPSLQLLTTQRTAPYNLLFSVSPVGIGWFALWALACSVLLILRLLALLSRKPGRPADDPTKAPN